MKSERLVALTDGVIAVIITIMVLELKPPHEATFEALRERGPVLLSYILSFIYIGIYWNNHHHFFQLAPRVNAGVMWANLNLLFWLSLVPFTTAWMGEHELTPVPTALYGASLLAAAVAWFVMQLTIMRLQGPDSPLRRALGRDWKGLLSPVLYLTGIGLAFVAPLLSDALYLAVALMWLVPDRRMEAAVTQA
ncbi:TMEM175 family protein [soil metagenome]